MRRTYIRTIMLFNLFINNYLIIILVVFIYKEIQFIFLMKFAIVTINIRFEHP